MAATFNIPVSVAGGSHIKARGLGASNSDSFGKGPPTLKTQRKSTQSGTIRNSPVCAAYNERGSGGGGDFVSGFLLGSAVCGTLAYIFAPQIRRSLLNEDEYGFARPRGPIFSDEGLEKARQTLNAKISHLNSAIDSVSSRLRGSNNSPPVPIESDPEVEATV